RGNEDQRLTSASQEFMANFPKDATKNNKVRNFTKQEKDMSITTASELIGMKKASEAVAYTLEEMRNFARPGISTKELDDYGGQILNDLGANSAPYLTYGFPGWTCISVNHEFCHGIPSSKSILKEGDLINIDVSAERDGFWSDNGGSFVIGEDRSEEHTSELQSRENLVCRLLLE